MLSLCLFSLITLSSLSLHHIVLPILSNNPALSIAILPTDFVFYSTVVQREHCLLLYRIQTLFSVLQ